MANNATPRALDPKFKDAQVPEDAQVPRDENRDGNKKAEEKQESPQESIARLSNPEIPNDPGEGNIVHRTQVVDSAGNVVEKVHGPMPRSEWPEYARKNNL